MKVAALDLGSNSFLCLIAEVTEGRVTRVYEDNVKVVRLGQGVQASGVFAAEALERADACLAEFAKRIAEHRVEHVLAMATSAARDVRNGDELLKIGAKYKIPIEIIPGDREAEITFGGATSHLPQDGKSRLVIDVGGGSTEFILGLDREVLFAKSLDIGCVRLTERFITQNPVPTGEQKKLEDFMNPLLRQVVTSLRGAGDGPSAPGSGGVSQFPMEILAVAGTPSAIALVDMGTDPQTVDWDHVDGYVLTRARLEKWTEEFFDTSLQHKIETLRIEAGRADVIAVGSLILLESLRALGLETLKVSTRGVRYGVALEIYKRRTR